MRLPTRFGRTVNRRSAFSGPISPRAGGRSAAVRDVAAYVNPYISQHVPLLWNALVPEFARDVDYWLGSDNTTSTSITIIWKEGSEDEDVSPGRYSRALVRDYDLPRPPLRGDTVVKDSVEYEVIRVDAFPFNHSQVLLQESE